MTTKPAFLQYSKKQNNITKYFVFLRLNGLTKLSFVKNKTEIETLDIFKMSRFSLR